MDKTKNICGAKTVSGQPCQKSPINDTGRCRLHGGKTPRGVDAPNHQGRGYSKYLPHRLRSIFDKAVADPNLTSLRSSIALIETRIITLMTELESGHGPLKLWHDLSQNWELLEGALKTKDNDLAQSAMLAIKRIIRVGAKEETAWKHLTEAIHDKSNLARSEHAILKDKQLMVPVVEVMALVGFIHGQITEHCDVETATKIGKNLARIIDMQRRASSGELGAGEMPVFGPPSDAGNTGDVIEGSVVDE